MARKNITQGELRAVVNWISEHPPRQADLGAIIEEVVSGLNGTVSSQATKHVLLALVSARAFERDPEGSPPSEQKLTLQPDVTTPEGLLALLQDAARTKLLAALGQVRDEILQELLG